MNFPSALRVSLAIAASTMTACSTSTWYTLVQAAQYDKCEQLGNAEDRRRCKAETYPDEDKYKAQKSKLSTPDK
jgi:hypothetical protein